MRMTESTKKIVRKVFLLCMLLVFTFSSEVDLSDHESVVGEENLQDFFNFTVYNNYLDDIFNHLIYDDVSSNCSIQTRNLLQKASEGDINALKILDSTGKPSSGILEGGVSFIGFYSECVNAVVNIKENDLKGQYCLINLNFSTYGHQKNIPDVSWKVLSQGHPTIGICIPSSCSAADLGNASTLSLGNSHGFIDSSVAVCHGNPSGFSRDVGAICILIVFIIFASIACIATIVDYIQEQKKSFSSSNDNSKTTSRELLCQNDPESSKRYILLECLLAFSVKSNAKKIFTVEGGGQNIQCLHGLKFLSMSLIILGHTFSFGTVNLFLRNPGAATKAPKDFLSQIFANGTLAVDTFYLVSGLLVSFITLKFLDKRGGKFPLLYFYFHRYFRLTPLLVAVVLFSGYLLRYVGSGPNWLDSIKMYDAWCKENWWINALYLHNFIKTEHMCLSHTWYLATDMQIYLIVPLMIIPLHKNFKFGAMSCLTFLLISIVTTAVITVINHYPAIPYINNIMDQDIVDRYYRDVYIKPYCRMGPYIIGIAVGYYLYKHTELILKKTTVALLWISSITLGLTIIYLMWPANQGILPTDSEAAAYSALARTAWGISLSWLVIACYYGYGGIINKILSWSLLVPFSRLTYSAYLIHPVVMNVYYGSTETVVDFSLSYMIYLFIGNICITFALSVVLSLLFESPFVVLEKVMLFKKSS